jgi:hypothetical protein
MILDPNGRAAKKNTETTFDPKLVLMLMALSDLLQQNGIGLFCMKCHRLGLPDGLESNNSEGSSTYKLTCGCATRVFNKQTGFEKVWTN